MRLTRKQLDVLIESLLYEQNYPYMSSPKELSQLEFEEYYKYGKKHGVFKGWWKNGQLDYEGQFKYNQRDGIWKAYYENGQLRQVTDFILQRKLSETCFTESGDEIDCEESLDGIW